MNVVQLLLRFTAHEVYMNFLDTINALPVLRPNGWPLHMCDAALITTSKNLDFAIQSSHKYDNINISYIALLDFNDINFYCKSNIYNIPQGTVRYLAERPDLERILFCPPKINFEIYDACIQLMDIGIHSFYVTDVLIPYDKSYNYLNNTRINIERIFSLFADEESRQIFTSNIKTRITGNNGYRIVSSYPEYQHPLVQNRPEDIIIDGGVGGNGEDGVGMTLKFAETVAQGHVYAFEPDPVNYLEAKNVLDKIENVTLEPFGLWESTGYISFASSGRNNLGSHIIQHGSDEGTCRIPVTTIDNFALEHCLQRLDVLKLDVEGAELQALKGGGGDDKTL
jgi:FkbM family methyltransferase